jgi:hypothetical protein
MAATAISASFTDQRCGLNHSRVANIARFAGCAIACSSTLTSRHLLEPAPAITREEIVHPLRGGRGCAVDVVCRHVVSLKSRAPRGGRRLAAAAVTL